jgi:hypothetical protein
MAYNNRLAWSKGMKIIMAPPHLATVAGVAELLVRTRDRDVGLLVFSEFIRH